MKCFELKMMEIVAVHCDQYRIKFSLKLKLSTHTSVPNYLVAYVDYQNYSYFDMNFWRILLCIIISNNLSFICIRLIPVSN